LAKEIELFAYKIILIYEEIQTFRKVNEAFAKRRRAKKTCVQAGGAFSIQDALDLIE